MRVLYRNRDLDLNARNDDLANSNSNGRITQVTRTLYSKWKLIKMKTYKNLYPRLCSYKNLELAFRKASRGKSKKFYVIEFKKDLEQKRRFTNLPN